MGHPDVAPLYEMKKSLDWEVDKFQGFVRFTEYDGMLGAVIHPKNYILPLLRGHFCGRFPEENFMIYDAVHQAVLLYQGHGLFSKVLGFRIKRWLQFYVYSAQV